MTIRLMIHSIITISTMVLAYWHSALWHEHIDIQYNEQVSIMTAITMTHSKNAFSIITLSIMA